MQLSFELILGKRYKEDDDEDFLPLPSSMRKRSKKEKAQECKWDFFESDLTDFPVETLKTPSKKHQF